MKKRIIFASTLAFMGLANAVSAVVVYQDTFDNDGLATNTGTGGTLTTEQNGTNNFGIDDDGDLTWDAAGGSGGNNGARRGGVVTTGSFSVANGFTLDVVYTVGNVLNSGASHSVGFGLISSNASLEGSFYADKAFDGIGMSLTTRNGNQGLNVDTAAGALSSLETGQNGNITTNANQTFSLTVDASGNYSLSINGATASTGTTTFDLSQDYYFASYVQNGGTDFSLHSVTLDAIPEPSSIVIFGCAALGFLARRRRV